MLQIIAWGLALLLICNGVAIVQRQRLADAEGHLGQSGLASFGGFCGIGGGLILFALTLIQADGDKAQMLVFGKENSAARAGREYLNSPAGCEEAKNLGFEVEGRC